MAYSMRTILSLQATPVVSWRIRAPLHIKNVDVIQVPLEGESKAARKGKKKIVTGCCRSLCLQFACDVKSFPRVGLSLEAYGSTRVCIFTFKFCALMCVME